MVVVNEVDKAKAAAAAVGLRILVQQLSSQNKCANLSSNVVLKSYNLLKLSGSGKSSFSIDICCRDNEEEEEDYYSKYSIKSCCLCKNKLRADKDVYMYKGDQGFCSVECRNRQIYLDDIADLEASTRKVLSSSSHCSLDNNNGIFQPEFRRNYSMSRRSRRLVLF